MLLRQLHRLLLCPVIAIWLIVYGCNSLSAEEQVTVFTYRAPESGNDLRYDYDTRLLQLALENTVETDGPYKLVPSPVMNYARAHSYLKTNVLPNFIVKLSYDPAFEVSGFDFVPFPVDLGIVGYRVCFAHPDVVDELMGTDSLSGLRDFTHGQGVGWADTDVLRHNGLTVREVSSYESLFKMVANRRFDLFCRGANELLDELNMHRHIDNLSYDKSMVIFYPLPRFFYTNMANLRALKRIERGLLKAYENGSLQKLWSQYYQESVDFVELDKRKQFNLVNPLLEQLDVDFQHYFYDPTQKK